MRVQGVIVPLVTPLGGQGIDKRASEVLVRFLVGAGVNGLFVSGTTGEGPLLSAEERKHLLAAVRHAAGADTTVLFGVGAPSTAECLELCDLAADGGADGVVAMPPYFYGVTQAEIVEHLSAIAGHSKLPVVLYDIPQRTGNRMSLDTLARLMEHENIVCIKDSSADMGHFQRVLARVRSDVTVLMGDDALILPAVAAGGHGAVSGLANVIPEAVVGLYDSSARGDLSGAQTLQQKIIKAQTAIMSEVSIIAALKAVLCERGINVGDPKPPLFGVSAEGRKRLCDAFTHAGFELSSVGDTI